MGTRVAKERELNKSFEHKQSVSSYQCENCLKKTKLAPDYDNRHFCCDNCRITYRKLKIKTPFVGEHIISPRTGIVHHGIGDNQGGVLHYAGLSEGATSAPVLRSSFHDFRQGHKIVVQPHKNRKYSLLESVKRAEQRLGESNYDMHSNNCEHFVNWCIDGKVKSKQVEKIATYTTGIIVFITVIVVFNLFAVTGFAAVGSSMLFPWLSGLHGTRLILLYSSLGIIGGLALITALSFTILRDYIWLSSAERRSRRIARRSAVLTVFVTAAVGFIYIYTLAQNILVGDLLERLGPGVVPKLVNISLFLVTALPAIVAISVGLLVHKILSRDISQV